MKIYISKHPWDKIIGRRTKCKIILLIIYLTGEGFVFVLKEIPVNKKVRHDDSVFFMKDIS